jgi:hypothetical protein
LLDAQDDVVGLCDVSEISLRAMASIMIGALSF